MPNGGGRLTRQRWPTAKLPEILSGPEATLTALVREYLFISLYKACAESLASENGSRLAAMQRAEKNIESLSAELRQSLLPPASKLDRRRTL
jgi:F-type H+-transporting ATPase subunit gamma